MSTIAPISVDGQPLALLCVASQVLLYFLLPLFTTTLFVAASDKSKAGEGLVELHLSSCQCK